jgi:hypothetical protein
MFVITRETIYFINLRNAYLLSPFNAAKISSRTVLFTDVPTEYLNIEKLQQLFGVAFIRAWLATDCSDLRDEVDNRDKAAMKLEGAEIKLSQTAVKRKLKWEKKAAKGKMKGKKGPNHNIADEEEASLASNFQKKKDRPTHRLGKIPLIGKKVDTINWARDELRTLIPKVEMEQAKHRRGKGKLLPAVFVEFSTQQAAQAAYRKMTPRKAPRMNPRAISVTPSEVVWKNLRIKKTERMGRKLATRTFLTLMIIFWSIPVAVVGAISNINYLQEKVPFLHFISHIPPVILGVVTGLLPSVLLSVLMSLVPIVCRCRHPFHLPHFHANDHRDVQTRRRSHPPQRRTHLSTLVHGLPSHPSLPRNHLRLRSRIHRLRHHQRTRLSHNPPSGEPPQSLQLLHLLHYRSRSWYRSWEYLEHWRIGHAHHRW